MHGDHCRRERGLAGYVRARAHRRLFMWFGVAIILTGLIAVTIVFTTSGGPGFREEMRRAENLIGRQFAELWDEPARRDSFARAISEELESGVSISDATGGAVASFGGACDDAHSLTSDVVRDGVLLGEVTICQQHRPRKVSFLLALLGAGVFLWIASGFLARHLMRPLVEVATVARELGEGKLDTRMKLSRRHTGEVHALADTFNQMATRLQKQLTDQKELLAAVSHEIRTPLGHMRILLDLARDGAVDEKTVDELEKEVLEIDTLVDQLLASSRLEFESLELHDLDAIEVVDRALARADVDAALFEQDAEKMPLRADPMLLGRALANLIDNAAEHGGGVTRVEAVRVDSGVCFVVEDHGPGFEEAERDRVFDSFYRGDRRAGAHHGSIGLGLSLVRRIATAHGGRAFAENRAGGGARVGFEIPNGCPPEVLEPRAQP